MKKFFLFATALLMSASMFAEGSVITYTAKEKLESQFAGLGTVVTHEFNEGNGTVTYSETITEIVKEAFSNCYALQSITLPEGIKTIRDQVFYKCSNLQSVTIPASVTTFGYQAFYQSGLTSITIPEGVTKIGTWAFSSCLALQSITLPGSVTEIGDYAFAYAGLTSVTFLGDACQNAIGESTFDGIGSSTPALLTLHGTWAKENQPDEDGNWYGGKFKVDDTALPQMRAAVKATKVMTNGQVIFRAENKNYTILGQEK